MNAWALLPAAVLTEVSASLALQAAIHRPGWYVLVVAGYATSLTMLWLMLRRGLSLNVVYAVWGACGVALTALFGMLVFGESMTVLIATGITLIIAGVLVMQLDPRLGHTAGTANAANTAATDS